MLGHLRDRGMNVDLYPGFGHEGEIAQFPLRNFAGHMTGFIQYRPGASKAPQNNPKDGRYYTFITKNQIGVFGLESIAFTNRIYLVGGMFKASTLHRLGFTALHVSSVAPKILRQQLDLLGRPVTAIGDNDDEGRQFAARWGGFTSPMDIDEMSDEKVLECLKNQK